MATHSSILTWRIPQTEEPGNSKHLTEEEEIKKRWQEYTEELYKNDLNDPENHNDVITHLDPDIWSLKSSEP